MIFMWFVWVGMQGVARERNLRTLRTLRSFENWTKYLTWPQMELNTPNDQTTPKAFVKFSGFVPE